MNSIVIIDDEKLVIRSLMASVDWGKYGFEVIGEAYNGPDGLAIIKEKKPDLVFVDIRMPGMSGLELINEVAHQGIETLFAIISGYAEFAYAQKAMSNGAICYCLKPFSESEIIECLRIAADKLDDKREMCKINLLMLLEESWRNEPEKIQRILKKLKIDEDLKNSIYIAVIIEKDNRKPDYPIHISKIRLGKNKQVLFIPKSEMNTFSTEIVPGFSDECISIGISREVKEAGDLKPAIDEASSAAWNYFITGKTSVIYRASDTAHDEADMLLENIKKYRYDRDHMDIDEIINQTSEIMEKGGLTANHIARFYNYLKEYIPVIDTEENDEDDYINIEQLSFIYADAREMMDAFKSSVNKKANTNLVRLNKIKNITAKQILEYVNQNFTDDIAIRQISHIFYINSSYLSQLFKKEVGEPFTKYLMKLRVQHACELLITTSMNISAIAEKSGYSDYFYFSRVFKKATGMTPSQYRSENAQ